MRWKPFSVFVAAGIAALCAMPSGFAAEPFLTFWPGSYLPERVQGKIWFGAMPVPGENAQLHWHSTSGGEARTELFRDERGVYYHPDVIGRTALGVLIIASLVPTEGVSGSTASDRSLWLVDKAGKAHPIGPTGSAGVRVAGYTEKGLNGGLLVVGFIDGETRVWYMDSEKNVRTLINGGARIPASDHRLVVLNGYAYFFRIASRGQRQLWRTDGTALRTTLVKTLVPNASSEVVSEIAVADRTLFFVERNSLGVCGLWKSDGTPAGTLMIKTLSPGARLTDFDTVNLQSLEVREPCERRVIAYSKRRVYFLSPAAEMIPISVYFNGDVQATTEVAASTDLVTLKQNRDGVWRETVTKSFTKNYVKGWGKFGGSLWIATANRRGDEAAYPGSSSRPLIWQLTPGMTPRRIRKYSSSFRIQQFIFHAGVPFAVSSVSGRGSPALLIDNLSSAAQGREGVGVVSREFQASDAPPSWLDRIAKYRGKFMFTANVGPNDGQLYAIDPVTLEQTAVSDF